MVEVVARGRCSSSSGVTWSCCAKASVAGSTRAAKRTAMRNRLFRGCIVAGLRINMQLGKSFRRKQFHFDLPPLAVLGRILRTVSEYILVGQFDSDLGGDVRQFAGTVDAERAAAGDFGDLAQQFRT